ncbi:MAG: hypothetical protein QM706_10530 [Nitrospira sp.]
MKYARNLVVGALGCASLMGCNGSVQDSGAGGNTSTVADSSLIVQEASLHPNPITRPGPVSVSLSTQDFGREGITFQYRWYVGGTLVPGETSTHLSTGNLKRGDLVAAEVTPVRGKTVGIPYKTAPVRIDNSLPTVDRVGLPQHILAGDSIQVEFGVTDLDNDEVRSRFRWRKNQDMVAETDVPVLETGGFVRGDSIRVAIIPRDGIGEGKEFMSAPVVVGNSIPKFTSNPVPIVADGVYRYQASAVDPDGDQITFELGQTHPGMSLNKMTGQLHWSIPSGLTGSHRITILAKDDHGGQVSQEFDLNLPGPPPLSSGT